MRRSCRRLSKNPITGTKEKNQKDRIKQNKNLWGKKLKLVFVFSKSRSPRVGAEKRDFRERHQVKGRTQTKIPTHLPMTQSSLPTSENGTIFAQGGRLSWFFILHWNNFSPPKCTPVMLITENMWVYFRAVHTFLSIIHSFIYLFKEDTVLDTVIALEKCTSELFTHFFPSFIPSFISLRKILC